MIWTLKVTCLAGPHHDGKCVRYIELDEESSLHDVHAAIQEAIHFDNEHGFAFFFAKAPNAKREYFPEGVDPDDDVDGDLYEDVPLADALSNAKSKTLFYLYNFDDEWTFSVEKEQKGKKPVSGEIYPLIIESRSEGADPMQYDNTEDDFATHEDAADRRRPRRARGADDYYRGDDDGFNDDDDSNDDDDFDDDDFGDDEDDSDDFDDEDSDDFDDDFDDDEEEKEEGSYEDERDDNW